MACDGLIYSVMHQSLSSHVQLYLLTPAYVFFAKISWPYYVYSLGNRP